MVSRFPQGGRSAPAGHGPRRPALGGNRDRPARAGPVRVLLVLCRPSGCPGCTGGNRSPWRGPRQLPRSREDPDRANRPCPGPQATKRAHQNDANQPAAVSLRRWAPAFASPAIRLASHRGENVPGTRQSSPINHIPGLQPGPRRRPCPPASGPPPHHPRPPAGLTHPSGRLPPREPSPGLLPGSNGRTLPDPRARPRYPET